MTNEYRTPEFVEIGKAEEVILGSKVPEALDDSIYQEASFDEFEE